MTRTEWQGRVRVSRSQVAQGLLGGLAIVMVVLMVQLRNSEDSAPFAGYYEETFTSRNQVTSAQARRDSFSLGMNEWEAAWPYGYGLGHTYRIVRPFGTGVQQPATFDNVPLDLLVRSGLIGLLLCAGAFLATVRDGVRTWRRHRDDTVAALALAAVAVLVGVMSKSVFESILEKDKIAVLIGLCAGAVAAASRTLASPAPAPQPPAINERQGALPWT